ncbi:MAG: MotA/TolQ/ExbB proton channel family protein [Planctomycetota bacterium]
MAGPLAQAAAAATPAAPPAPGAAANAVEKPKSLLDYYWEGGPLMHPILLCSILGAGVIVERLIRLRRDRIINDPVVDGVREALLAGRKEEALNTAQSDKRLCSFIVARALDDHIYTHATLEDALAEAGERHIDALSARMSVLSVVIKVAPMLGLLGTVQGIIYAFGNITGGVVVKQKMANDIMMALVTTFAGLSVAIPALIGESYVKGVIRARIADLEEIFISLVKADHIAGLNREGGAKLELVKDATGSGVRTAPAGTSERARLAGNK